MKTMGFGSLSLDPLSGGLAILRAYSPTLGHFELPMVADEVLLFLVETSNALAACREEELRKRQEDELKVEERR